MRGKERWRSPFTKTIIRQKDIDNKEGFMSTPNIFRYATTELSQDAFICYLVACASEATGTLKECGKAFVRALFRAGASGGTKDIPVLDSNGNLLAPYNGPCEVSDVCTPVRQYGKEKIDVYFQAKVDGQMGSFNIEDKVDTEAHSNQLKRSLDYVINDDQKENLIKPVYFKTGYVFDDERESVENDNYSVFEAEDLKKILDCHPDAIRENQILCQYSEYLNDKIQTRAEALKNWDFEQDYVQWEFMQELRDVLRGAACQWNHFVPYTLSGDWNGLSRDNPRGTPWTQHGFSEHLYWRIESGSPLLLKIGLASTGMNYDQDYDEIQEYRRLFDQALQQEEGLCDGNFLLIKAKEECTIGSIDTAELRGMTKSEFREFLDRVTRVHIRFLESISQIYMCRR